MRLIKTIIPLFLIVLCAIAQPQETTSPVQYKELTAFKKNGDGELWRNVVVSPKIKRDELIALAQFLHRKYSTTPIRIFTNDKQFDAFMMWDLHYPHPAYPAPKEWLTKHGLAKIQATSNNGGNTWQWFLWPVNSVSYKFVPEGAEVIAEL